MPISLVGLALVELGFAVVSSLINKNNGASVNVIIPIRLPLVCLYGKMASLQGVS